MKPSGNQKKKLRKSFIFVLHDPYIQRGGGGVFGFYFYFSFEHFWRGRRRDNRRSTLADEQEELKMFLSLY